MNATQCSTSQPETTRVTALLLIAHSEKAGEQGQAAKGSSAAGLGRLVVGSLALAGARLYQAPAPLTACMMKMQQLETMLFQDNWDSGKSHVTKQGSSHAR